MAVKPFSSELKLTWAASLRFGPDEGNNTLIQYFNESGILLTATLTATALEDLRPLPESVSSCHARKLCSAAESVEAVNVRAVSSQHHDNKTK